MRFRFIEDRRADYPVRIMCDVLGVSPAGYYAWRARPESQRSAANRDLVDDIKRVLRAENIPFDASGDRILVNTERKEEAIAALALEQVLPRAERREFAGLDHGASGNADRRGKPARVGAELRTFLARP